MQERDVTSVSKCVVIIKKHVMPISKELLCREYGVTPISMCCSYQEKWRHMLSDCFIHEEFFFIIESRWVECIVYYAFMLFDFILIAKPYVCELTCLLVFCTKRINSDYRANPYPYSSWVNCVY